MMRLETNVRSKTDMSTLRAKKENQPVQQTQSRLILHQHFEGES